MTTTIDVRADIVADVVALERAALDRWGQGDPTAYLDRFEPDITYFDPMVGKIRVDRYDMLHPVVQHCGDVAVLSFNLVSYRTDDGVERALSRWNATEVYRHTPRGWRIWHSHWSFTQPALKEPVTEDASSGGA